MFIEIWNQQTPILNCFKYYHNLFKYSMIKSEDVQEPYQLQIGSHLVNKKYTVIGKLGTGTYSSVYAISMIKGQKHILRAVKVQRESVKQPQISTEVSVLKFIKEHGPDEIGFAKHYEYGYEKQFHYLIMTLLGPNLQQLMRLCGGNLSLRTTMMVGLQIIDRLQVLHNLNYVYGDVKPDNFLVGLGAQSQFIFIVDFGKCKRYRNKGNGQHIQYKQNIQYSFSPIFASINAHNKIQYSRRDDIQSLIYMIVYLRVGKLPWTKNMEKKGKNDMNTQQMKKRVTPEMLCHKMPLQIIDLLYYVRTIQFYERPDYDFIRKCFYKCLEREMKDFNIIYDWNRLEEVDFKVYNGEPKITLKINQLESLREQEAIAEEEIEDNSKDNQDQNDRLI